MTSFKVFIEDEKCVCLNYLDADIRIWLPKWAIGKIGAPKTRQYIYNFLEHVDLVKSQLHAMTNQTTPFTLKLL